MQIQAYTRTNKHTYGHTYMRTHMHVHNLDIRAHICVYFHMQGTCCPRCVLNGCFSGKISRAEWREWARQKREMMQKFNSEKEALVADNKRLRAALDPTVKQCVHVRLCHHLHCFVTIVFLAFHPRYCCSSLRNHFINDVFGSRHSVR